MKDKLMDETNNQYQSMYKLACELAEKDIKNGVVREKKKQDRIVWHMRNMKELYKMRYMGMFNEWLQEAPK